MEQASKMCSLWIDDHSVETKNVTIGELKEFKGHPFKVINDNSLYELMKSIEDNGVLVPLIVRPSQDGSGYEIISGHRRKVASEWVGLSTIPVTVMVLCQDLVQTKMSDFAC